MAQQFARPNADGANINWTPSTGTVHYVLVDEVVPDDSDYVSVGTGFAPSPDETYGLSSITDPGASDGHTIWVRAKQASGTTSITVNLYQGNPNAFGFTFVAAGTFSLTTSFADYSYTLTAAEANSITDYSDLWFDLVRGSTKGGITQTVSQIYFEVNPAGPAEAPSMQVILVT